MADLLHRVVVRPNKDMFVQPVDRGSQHENPLLRFAHEPQWEAEVERVSGALWGRDN